MEQIHIYVCKLSPKGMQSRSAVCGDISLQRFGFTHTTMKSMKFPLLNETIECYLTVNVMQRCSELRGYCITFIYIHICLVHFCFATLGVRTFA